MSALASYIAAVFREPRDDSWAIAIAEPPHPPAIEVTPAPMPVLDTRPRCAKCEEPIGFEVTRLELEDRWYHWPRCFGGTE